MNNAKIAMDNVELTDEKILDHAPRLRMKMQELVRIIEAIDAIKSSSHWETLKLYVFGGAVETIQNRIRTVKDTTDMFRLQGQLAWAEKYSDLEKLKVFYSNELIKVRKQLNIDGK